MAVVATKEIKKKRMLIIVFSALVVGTFVILYYGGVFGKKSVTVPVTQPSQNQISPESFKEQPESATFELKIGIFEDAQFKALQKVQIPTQASATPGKANPFSD